MNFDRDTILKFKAMHKADYNFAEAARMLRKDAPWTLTTKEAIGGTTAAGITGDLNALIGAEFLMSVENDPVGVFDMIRPQTRQSGFHVPLYLGSGISASVHTEGTSIPVSKYAVDDTGLTPQKVAGLAISTNEALNFDEGIITLLQELKQAVSLVTDQTFLSGVITDADSTQAASSDPVSDLKDLFDAVNRTGFSKLRFVCSPAVANELAVYADGYRVFQNATPTGGDVYGVQMLVTSALTTSAVLLDCNAIVTASADMKVRRSLNASVEMETVPSGNSETPDTLTGHPTSMFQTDSTAFLASRTFASKLLRATGAAVLTSIAWGESS